MIMTTTNENSIEFKYVITFFREDKRIEKLKKYLDRDNVFYQELDDVDVGSIWEKKIIKKAFYFYFEKGKLLDIMAIVGGDFYRTDVTTYCIEA